MATWRWYRLPLLLISAGLCQCCTLPDFLHTAQGNDNEFWQYNSTLEGHGVKVTVTDHTILGQQMSWNQADGNAPDVFEGECVQQTEELPHPGFLFQFNVSSGVSLDNETHVQFVCYQFVPLSATSPKVILVRKSDVSDVLDPAICNQKQLDPAPWIANAERPVVSHDCLFTGGYLFSTTQVPAPPGGLCPGHPIRPLLEADCTSGDGMHLWFPDVQCVPSQTGWSAVQSLMCLESWTEGNYTFQLLAEEPNKPQWCMRVLSSDRGKAAFTVDIFQDLMCPADIPGTDSHYIKLHLNLFDTKFCTDEAGQGVFHSWAACDHHFLFHYHRSSCEVCDARCTDTCDSSACQSSMALDCPKTCHGCTDPNDPCKFASDVMPLGTWQEISSQGDIISKTNVTFDHAFVNISGFNPMACHKKVDDTTFATTVAVAQGCRVRYSCIKIQRPTAQSPLVAYKIAQNVVWSDIKHPPIGRYNKDQDGWQLCADQRFVDDPPPLRTVYHSQHSKNLLATNSSLFTHTVPCGFGGRFAVNTSGESGATCRGFLSDMEDCMPQERANLQLHCPQPQPNVTKDLTCLGQFPGGADDINLIITSHVTDEHEQQVTCWVVHRTGKSSATLYQLHTVQCNEATWWEIRAGTADIATTLYASLLDGCPVEKSTPMKPGLIALYTAFCISMVTLLALLGYKLFRRCRPKNPYRII